MAFIEYSQKYYVDSKDIRVFPCAYRGYYDTDGSNTKVFDPEARSTTESNFADTFSKLSLKKTSYIVDWSSNTLKCVIDGYYFEIKNCTINDFFTIDQNNRVIPNALCITPKEIKLSNSTEDGDRYTQILGSFSGDVDYLDSYISASGKYIFTGLCMISSEHTLVDTAGVKSLIPFKATATGKTVEGKPEYLRELDYSKLAITELLDAGEGKYSVRMLSDTDGSTSNDAQANGDYSAAFGKRTKAGKFSGTFGNLTEATGEAAFAVGDTSKALANGAIAGGDHATATNTGSIALGTYVTTTADNQVVLGKYNATDNTKAFILANGTSSSAPYNILTVSYEGDVAAKGDLDIDGKADIGGTLNVSGALSTNSTLTTKGNITANGNGGNNLVLGSSTSDSYGSISVYGEGTTKVFEVTKDGTLEIAGKAKSSSTSDSDNDNTLTTKGYMVSYVEDAITNRISGKADSTTVATNLTNAIKEAKDELKSHNATEIAKAVAAAKTELLKSVSDDFAARDTSSKTPVTGNGTGKYLLSVSQTNGQIESTEGSFVSSVSVDNTLDAPTAAAVYSHVATAVSNIWTSDVVKETSTATSKNSLQSIILDAAYPVGSIFTYYSDKNETTCPIANTLGGTWEKIDGGTFLCAANSDANSIYNRQKTGGFEETQLKSHYHELVRNSDSNTKTKVTTTSNGAHTHKLTLKARAHDADPDTGLRSGNVNGGCHQWTFSWTDAIESNGAHTHTVDLTNIKTQSAGTDISTTKGTNLPPYLAVYMWRRTA